MIEFDLKDHDFIALNNLLKLLHLVQSGGEANQYITNGEVLVNNKIETQKRKKIRFGDTVVFQGKKVVVK